MQIREYFYQLDREGRLYHDKTLLTDPQFLDFFFKRIRIDSEKGHSEYPFVSVCGKEMNYIAPEDTVFVFHKLKGNMLYYSPGLSVEFQPNSLRLSHKGQLYHPAPMDLWGRCNTKLLLDLSQYVQEGKNQFNFHYKDQIYPIREFE